MLWLSIVNSATFYEAHYVPFLKNSITGNHPVRRDMKYFSFSNAITVVVFYCQVCHKRL